MELIPYSEFAKLRMRQFAQPGESVYERDGWEWMGGVWINEAIAAGTSVSRLEKLPDEAGGLEIDFRDLAPERVANIFEAIHLPLRQGMTLQQVEQFLGKPEETVNYVEDRKGYSWTIGSNCPYYVHCTIRDSEGLIGVSVIRKDVLLKCDA